MKRRRLFAFAICGVVACGDDSSSTGTDAAIDATVADAPVDGPTDAPIDSPTDAPIDATPPPPFVGTITVIEGQVLAPAPAPAGNVAAQGIQLGVTFFDTANAVAPILDTNPGSPLGCKVTEYDTPAEIAGAVGINEGSVQFTVNNGGGPPDWTFPACIHAGPGVGYSCPDPSSSQAITAINNVTLGPAGAPPSTLTLLTVVSGGVTFAVEDVGRYVKFSGTGIAGLDHPTAAVPIVALGPSANLAVLGTSAVITAPVTSGMLTTLGGAGPFPMLPDPGQLGDGAIATATLTPGGGNHFPATTITYQDVGDDFTMDATNAGTLRNIPLDGSAFSLSCDACGSAISTVLNITTTDGIITGLSPFAMPPATGKRVNIRCAEVGATMITVPTSVSAFLMNSGATRVQANFVRGTFGTAAPADPGLTSVIAGHAIVGFTTRP